MPKERTTPPGRLVEFSRYRRRKALKLFGSQCKLITTFKSSNISRRGSLYCKADGLDRDDGIGGGGGGDGEGRL
ncbi:hypothetical protein M0804_003420 [Polistes exclamans]|nr:hypothetical protein M0804_003420 [Polistes exclamans]